MKKAEIVGYAVCRNNNEEFVEDAALCTDITDAYKALKFYQKLGSKVWLEPRHIVLPA